MLTDPIADFLIQIKNAYRAGKNTLVLPYSKLKEALAHLLSTEGYIGKVEMQKIDKIKKSLFIGLLYDGKKPKLTEVVRISKVGRRVYVGKKKIPYILGGMGIAILSTPKGLLTNKQTQKKGIGGELICKLW